MSDDDSISKRERQRVRRGVKREEEQRLAARARRRRIATIAAISLVLVGVAGAAVANVVRKRLDAAERERIAEARMDELGCTEIEEIPVGDTTHFGGEELAANPPQIAYPDRPASGGRMAGGDAAPGVYDEQVDERLLVHSLEHGSALVYYSTSADTAAIERVKDFGRRHLADFDKLIVAPWPDPLPQEASFAALSWGKRQLCREFDDDVFLSYVERNHGGRSGAPEAFSQMGGGNNPVRPDGDGPFLLPPLSGQPPPASPAGDESPAPDASPPADVSPAPDLTEPEPPPPGPTGPEPTEPEPTEPEPEPSAAEPAASPTGGG